jgi:hypothetical protein
VILAGAFLLLAILAFAARALRNGKPEALRTAH